jgi:hypothetical protein
MAAPTHQGREPAKALGPNVTSLLAARLRRNGYDAEAADLLASGAAVLDDLKRRREKRQPEPLREGKQSVIVLKQHAIGDCVHRLPRGSHDGGRTG